MKAVRAALAKVRRPMAAAALALASATCVLAASAPAAASEGTQSCLWQASLGTTAGGVVASVEDPCGGQVRLVLLRNNEVIVDLGGAVAITVVHHCTGFSENEFRLFTETETVNCY